MKWNNLEKPTDEVDVESKNGDLEFFCGGFAWLVQMPSCNVVCFKYKADSKTTFKNSLRTFLFCLKNHRIQFIRVEGCPGRYRFLMNPNFFPVLKKRGLNVRYNKEESLKLRRDVFYVKVY